MLNYYAVIQGIFKNQIIVYTTTLKEARKEYQKMIKLKSRQDTRIEKIKPITKKRWALPEKNLHTIVLSTNNDNFPKGYSYVENLQ